MKKIILLFAVAAVICQGEKCSGDTIVISNDKDVILDKDLYDYSTKI